MSPAADARASGTFQLGGDLPVVRLGYGAMQLTGPGIWGYPADRDAAVQVLRRAVEFGVTFIDTADSYGPHVNEELIREAFHPTTGQPYPDGLVIATKAGFLRPSRDRWEMHGHPAYLRQQVELSLRRLDVERIDLFQLHRVDPAYPLEDQVGELAALREEGKIRHLGLSEVTVEQLEAAQRVAPIVSVQNYYNLGNREADPLLAHCEQHGIAFIPWCPLDSGALLGEGTPLTLAAERLGFQAIPEGSYGLGLFDYGNGWIGHTGQLIGWESIVLYNQDTGAAFTAIVNDTGNLTAAEAVAFTVLPDLGGLFGF